MAIVRVICGGTSIESDRLVGQTVATARTRAAAALSLSGGETADVESAGQAGFVAVQENYVLRDGDTLRFSRTAGEKGLA